MSSANDACLCERRVGPSHVHRLSTPPSRARLGARCSRRLTACDDLTCECEKAALPPPHSPPFVCLLLVPGPDPSDPTTLFHSGFAPLACASTGGQSISLLYSLRLREALAWRPTALQFDTSIWMESLTASLPDRGMRVCMRAHAVRGVSYGLAAP